MKYKLLNQKAQTPVMKTKPRDINSASNSKKGHKRTKSVQEQQLKKVQ
jgi:hypothetical protein